MIKVAESQRVSYFGSNLKKRGAKSLLFGWIVLMIMNWHFFLEDLSQSGKLSEINLTLDFIFRFTVLLCLHHLLVREESNGSFKTPH